ncbi:MAG: 4-(cytidine 5'-diphospho)-2-C-methyl-D-erythritol kinase [Lachnospiraceae bacterium]|nr:4-(cytidine 5'-diphospho)-2-C-methyl-D-erythritol kinase [Lachnospiraceae bacterium]
MVNEMRTRARAKINLALDITGTRADGYHDVRMIMQSLRLYDDIYLRKIPEPEIRLSSNFRFIPTNQMNLAYQAAELLFKEFNLPGGIAIDLNKRIPAAAGLAGGSSDAASVLFAISRMYDLPLSRGMLMKRGLTIGADVPFCLMRGTALAEGIGEELTRLPAAPHYYVLLVTPPFGVSTRKVYTELDTLTEALKHPDVDAMIREIERPQGALPKLLGNCLEQVTIPMHPEIADIKKDMIALGACASLMSGSGPTVFGLFEDADTMKAAYNTLRAHCYPGRINYTEFYDPAAEFSQKNVQRNEQ